MVLNLVLESVGVTGCKLFGSVSGELNRQPTYLNYKISLLRVLFACLNAVVS